MCGQALRLLYDQRRAKAVCVCFHKKKTSALDGSHDIIWKWSVESKVSTFGAVRINFVKIKQHQEPYVKVMFFWLKVFPADMLLCELCLDFFLLTISWWFWWGFLFCCGRIARWSQTEDLVSCEIQVVFIVNTSNFWHGVTYYYA